MSTTVNGVSRITVVAPKTRMDLALPSDVPLAQLLPVVLQQIGQDMTDEGATNGGWVLSRLGDRPLDTTRTPAQLGIRDGELLYFTSRAAARPEVVFDDVVDAVATATNDRGGRWDDTTTRRFGVGTAAGLLGLGALLLLLSGPPQVVNGAVGLGVAVVLLVIAALLSRAAGDSRSAGVVAAVGILYSFAGGLLLLAGDRPLTGLAAPHVLLAGTAGLIAAAVAAPAVGDSAPQFLGAAAGGVALILAATVSLLTGASAAAAAAPVAAVFFALHPALPMLAYRLARVPIPSVPTGPDDLKTDSSSVDGQRVLDLSDRADDFLAGLILTVSAVVLGALVALAFDTGVPALLLSLVLSLLLMLRARPFGSRRERMPSLLAGAAGLGVTALSAFAGGGTAGRLLLGVGGLVLVAAISLGYALMVAGRRIAPIWGRLLDIGEMLLILAVVPLTAWVCGLFGWVLTL